MIKKKLTDEKNNYLDNRKCMRKNYLFSFINLNCKIESIVQIDLPIGNFGKQNSKRNGFMPIMK